jgi:hypothetical protein
LKKTITKIGLVEWLKMKALSSSLSTEKKKKRNLDYYLERIGFTIPGVPTTERTF